jgi:hypothetical protein
LWLSPTARRACVEGILGVRRGAGDYAPPAASAVRWLISRRSR